MTPNQALQHQIEKTITSNQSVTRFTINRKRLTDKWSLYVDIFANPQPLEPYDLYANIHFNMVKYVKYMLSYAKSIGSHPTYKSSYSSAIWMIFAVLKKDYDVISTDHHITHAGVAGIIYQFLHDLKLYERDQQAVVQIHDLFYDPQLINQLKDVVTPAMLDVLGYQE